MAEIMAEINYQKKSWLVKYIIPKLCHPPFAALSIKRK